MAGAILERELAATSRHGVEFAVANRTDDTEIRRLLRANPMAGSISVSLEREPDYFADANLLGEAKQTIVARENGRIVCVGSCTIRQRFINGKPRRVGYLGGLRLDQSHIGRFDILRRGYEFFRELQTAAPAELYFTSIASDNERARYFLERGLRGMPRYEFIGEFITLLLPTGGRPSCRTEPSLDRFSLNDLATRLNTHNSHFQFAPVWTGGELISLENLGLRASDFHVFHEDGSMSAGAALWNQQQFKQTVIRGYRQPLAFLRPAYNLSARLFGQPRLPAIGAGLSNAFVSHLFGNEQQSDKLIQLIYELRSSASQRAIELITLGFAANDPHLEVVCRQFRHRKYRSRIYTVCWPNIGESSDRLNGAILAPEVSLL
jgi:hypothetical protein